MNNSIFRLKHLAAVTLIATALPAVAQGTPATEYTANAILTVVGVVKPRACTVKFNNSGQIDYGTVKVDQLEVDEANQRLWLGKRDLDFIVTCSKEASIRMTITDLRADSVTHKINTMGAGFAYGLGHHKRVPIGMYHIALLPNGSTGDNLIVVPSVSNDGRTGWDAATGPFYAATGRWLGWAPSERQPPGAFKLLTTKLQLEAFLPIGALSAVGEDEMVLQGMANFEIKYT